LLQLIRKYRAIKDRQLRSASKNRCADRQSQVGGVEVQTVAPDGRNHNKFAIIDGRRVLTGSYNWTLKSEENWENLLILDCPALAKSYESEWEAYSLISASFNHMSLFLISCA
jgi:phosphatidylserine/phosphatidylglycerophosphate/cardiolipin synthase-like enzyme